MSSYRRNTGHLVLSVLLFTLSFAVKAQTPTLPGWYDSRWKIVDSLANKKGLTVSALTEINTICNRARQDRNDPQLIKALIYRIRLQQGREEDADLHAIALLDSQINITTQPSARAILNSTQAGMYWRYFQNNRYQLYQRTATTGITKKDPSSWSADDFHKKIGDLFLASIKDEQLLQRTRLDAYDPILEKGNVRNLRPTLFDLLAHRALEYFQTDDRDLNRPAAAFEIDDTAAYAPAAIFASHQFRTTDTLSLKLNALRLFQRLLQFHLADQQPAALLDLDIERIVFVNNSSVSYNKQDLYMRALKGLTDRYDRDPAAAQAWYLQASYYNDLAAGYSPYEDSTGRYGYVKAKEICEKVIAEKDSSEGQAGCMNLLNGIRQKSLELRMENVNIPGQPMRGMLTWRNFTRLYWRLIPVSHAIKEDLGNSAWQDSWWKKLLQLPTQRSADQDLPQTDDFQPHHAELKIDALPVGEYVLLASASPSFELAKNVMAAQFFYVSSIAYAANDNNYFVLDRQTGHPLPGATVQLWNRDYNNKTAKYEPHKAETYTTDSHGSFVLQRQLYRQNALEPLLEFTTAKDHLFSDQSTDFVYSDAAAASVSRQQYEKNNLQTFLFTDRSIYRPGQTLYYKGIVVTKDFDTRQSKSLTGFQTKIILYDANGTRVDSTTVTTNAYGSYKGQFTLPANLLNGEFHIEDDSTGGQNNFSVEEYKRPKFFVEYDKVKGSYRVNDTISINGNATAYAGNAISGATVKYRVTRQARYPIWYGRWRNPVMDRGQEIAHGEIRTDAAGKFNIHFIALPDRSNNEKSDPIFEYSITADITDINNETRSGKTTVQAGYRTIELTITRPASANMPADSLKTLQVRAANLSGEPVPALVDISIYPLKAPDRLIRKRLWERPDQFLMSKDEYLRNFPLDEYDNELDQTSWERGNKIFAATDSAGRTQSLIPQNGKPLKPGNYLVEASTKDQYGRIAIEKMYLRLYSPDAPAQPSWLWTSDAGEGVQTVEPGARATLDIGSSAADIFLIRKTEKGAGKDQSSFSYLSLDKNHQRTELPITESDRGGFIVSDLFIRDNRPYTYTHRIDVPWTNKELSISYQTWRDKTLPGSEEHWQLKIAGNKTDKVTAEILTAMYDASLDQFKPQQWSVPDLYPSFSGGEGWNTFSNFSAVLARQNINNSNSYVSYPKNYDVLLDPNTVGPNPHIRRYTRSGEMFVHAESRKLASPMAALSGRTPGLAIQVPDLEKDADGSKGIMRDTVIIEDNSSSSKPASSPTQNPVQVRTNLKETAFFFPDLHTDSEGNLSLSFTMPEALTKWKMMTLAHTKDLSFGYSEKTVVTQKQLMVQPNMPRFLREGDRMELSVKVVNLTDTEMTGQMELQLIDPTTGHTADGQFTNRQPNQYFTVEAKQSAIVNFPIDIPYQYNKPLTWRVVAHARQYSDGEEATLPVVSNRMLVTESLPLNLPGDGTRQFKFDKLINSGNSETLSQHALTVEFTGNPAWYAVQALPYLMEYPYECAEQTFNRFYANALASKIVSGAPRIQAIFSQWKNLDTAALLSNLEKNQELKSVLLQETPWVLQGKSESQQKKNIALLFDMVRLNSQLESTLTRLAAMQSPAGGFVWFKGGPDDRYITQYILTGIGHLQKLQAIPQTCANKINAIVRNAIPYLDQQIKKDYQEVLRLQKAQTAATPKSAKAGQPPAKSARPAATAKIAWIDAIPAQYLYMRSLFEQGIPGDVLPAVSYYRKQAQQSWQQQGRFQQGMIALALYRTGDIQTAKNIMASLRENAIRDEEKGMYWKNMERGYYWYQAPIETQSLLIEAFHTISPDAGIERDCKTWLLRQKQTHSWPTTRATADACYALLLDGMDWLSAERDVRIQLGDKTATSTETGSEAGTGYFKKVFDGPFVNPSMGNITVSVSTHQANVASAGTPATASPSTATITAGTTSRNSPAPPAGASTGRAAGLPAWGAVYWQYFDNLDHISAAENSKAPLKLTKRLFLQRNTDRGVVLEPIAENAALHPGDKVTVRIEISSDRDLEYVHMKDMRASCMEPVNVLSDYKWQGGLGYYETTKDASTDFFFSRLPRGTFVFEYPLFVGQTGNFSNGVTSIECMYAPEFSFHSEGIRVNVENPTP